MNNQIYTSVKRAINQVQATASDAKEDGTQANQAAIQLQYKEMFK